jgi:hypothetical protein
MEISWKNLNCNKPVISRNQDLTEISFSEFYFRLIYCTKIWTCVGIRGIQTVWSGGNIWTCVAYSRRTGERRVLEAKLETFEFILSTTWCTTSHYSSFRTKQHHKKEQSCNKCTKCNLVYFYRHSKCRRVWNR